MAEAPEVKAVVEEFLARQREMYAGGDLAAVEELVAEHVVWHVPGAATRGCSTRRRPAATCRAATGTTSPRRRASAS
jgi:hypothetical protein